ncbi:tetratricopeptide repeat protein [Fulvivirga sediminis]|uniref:Tetratricopeptide repeat protein n=1 Tax=Fulvivirga sediminis TaxID=2803949 RepID=A0A937FD60_9BACT|nr:CDC27 family protein [Fulvivirga sediminis]MBL3658248.1 tetratricopeptide repeat protein [Fulvivirga sediminis]
MRILLIFIPLITISSCVKYSRDPMETLEMKVDTDQTLEYLQDLESDYASEPQLYYQLARTYYQKGNYAAADNNIKKAINLAEGNPDYYYLEGKVQQKLNHSNRAIKSLLTAEALGMKSFDLYRILATEYLNESQVDKAKASVERLLQLEQTGEGYRLKGDVMLVMNDTTDAIENYDKALKLNSKETASHLRLYDIYARQQLYDKAEYHIDKLLQISPKKTAYIENKAYLLSNTDRLDTAKLLYKTLVEERGELKDLYNLANTFYKMREYDSAQLVSNKAYEEDNSFLAARLITARSLDKQRQYQLAIQTYEEILAKDSTNNLAQTELEVLRRKVAYLWRLQQEKQSQEETGDNPPAAVEKKEVTIEE